MSCSIKKFSESRVESLGATHLESRMVAYFDYSITALGRLRELVDSNASSTAIKSQLNLVEFNLEWASIYREELAGRKS